APAARGYPAAAAGEGRARDRASCGALPGANLLHLRFQNVLKQVWYSGRAEARQARRATMALVRTASPHARIHEEPSFSRAEAAFCWSHPEKGVRIAAWGEEQRREGGSLRALLGDLAEGGFPDVPGPWFGATAFAGRLGAGWSGFPPMRFVLPQRIAWSDGTRHFSAGDGATTTEEE